MSSGKLQAPRPVLRATAPVPIPVPPDPPPDPKKRKGRPDRTVATFENKYIEFRTVKMRLNQFVLANTGIIEIIGESVKVMNHINYLIYHFLNFHFLRLLDLQLPIPQQIDQDMIQKAYQSVSNLNGEFQLQHESEDSEWSKSTQIFRDALNESHLSKIYNFPEREKRCILANNSSQMISIAVNNHLDLNFRSRFIKFLKLTYKERNGAKVHYWADRILNIRVPHPDHPNRFDKDERSQIIIRTYRERFGIIDTSEVDISGNLPIFLKFYQEMLVLFKEKETKLFTLLPQKGAFGDDYIKIDSGSLADIVSLANDEASCRNKLKDPEIKDALWKKLFNVNKVEMRNFRFADEITTDGYAVSITIKQFVRPFPEGYNYDWDFYQKADFIKKYYNQLKDAAKNLKDAAKNAPKQPKPEPKEPENPFKDVEWTKYLKILGLDPGRCNMFSVYDPDTDKFYKCSRKEYHHRTGLTKNKKWFNNRVSKFETQQGLNNISFKQTNHLAYLANLKAIVPKLTNLFTFYGANCCKKRKFTSYTKKQKTLRMLVERLNLGKNKKTNRTTYIGFGDGSVNTNGCIKGAKLPCAGFFNKLNEHPLIRVERVGEQYTTKRDFNTKRDTVPVYGWKTKTLENDEKVQVWTTIHGLRRCSHNEGCTLWNRDLNASLNIREVTVALIKKQTRPEYLTKNWDPDAIGQNRAN